MEKELNLNAEPEITEELEIDLGDQNQFFVANNGNIFGIAFDKLFNQPQLNVYNTFEMSSKRNFKNLTPIILETYEELLLDENGDLTEAAEFILFNMLHIKSELMVAAADNKAVGFEEFKAFLEKLIDGGDRVLYNVIDTFVDEHYSLSLDEITEDSRNKKRKINTELQFKDSHAKELLKIAYLYRIAIPIISVYFYYNKGNFVKNGAEIVERDVDNLERLDFLAEEDASEMEFEEVNNLVFAYLFDKFASKPEALRNKLYRLAYSGVSKTSYSDSRFWKVAKNIAITEKTETLEIYRKLLTNAIPKLSIAGDKNVVSFLQSVIRNQVDFLFQNKFKYRFVPMGNTDMQASTSDNDDSMTEFERMEILQSRKNEGSYLIRKLSIEETVKNIEENFDVGVSDAEVKDAMKTLKRSAIQEQIVSLMTFKYFRDKDALRYIDFYNYCYIVLCCKKYLLQQKYRYLPMILTAECEKHRERVNLTGRKVKPDILNSKIYNKMISEKYTNFSEDIEKIFLSFIGTVYSSVFKNENGEELFDSTVKVGKIAQEALDLLRLI